MNLGEWRLALAYPALARLPLSLAWRSAARIGRWSGPERRNALIAVRAGLEKAFPGIGADAKRLRGWTRDYLDMFSHEAMDVFCMPRLNRENVGRYIHLRGMDHLEETRRGGLGVILVLNHYSRVIMILVRLGLLGVRMSMLTMRIDEGNPDLSPFMRAFLRTKVERLLGFMGGKCLTLGENLRPVYEGLRRGEIWIILSDAYMPQFGSWREFPFLGGILRLPGGIERIAARTGARLIYGVTHESGPDRLDCELRPLPPDPAEGLAAAVRELEKDVLASPGEWWQWNILDYIWRPA